MTQGELYIYLRRHAEPIYGLREATQIVNMLFEEMWGVTRMAMLLERDAPSPIEQERAEQIAREIDAGRPVQYIIGEAELCDLRFVVREGVLIPRPESEELVRWVVSKYREQSGCRVLDIGTGSGVLAISLGRQLPESMVVALDISDEALSIARENIERLCPSVQLVKGDALEGAEHYVAGEFDIIISNPPYIPHSEVSQMRVNVTHHEPHQALFVPDDDPLIFYRRIAQSSQVLLREGGALYFEIHEEFAEECRAMLHQLGYTDVELRLDINDKARMVCAQR